MGREEAGEEKEDFFTRYIYMYISKWSKINKFTKSPVVVAGISKFGFFVHMAILKNKIPSPEMACGPKLQNFINKKIQCWKENGS